MQINYCIKSFEIVPDKNNEALFYTPEVSANIKHAKVIDLLMDIKGNKFSCITEEWLEKLINKHELANTPIKKYLISDLKLMSSIDENAFTKLFIISDEHVIKKRLNKYFSDHYALEVFTQMNLSKLDDRSLVVLYANVYSEKKMSEVYQHCIAANAWIITAYIANHYLVIDSIFNAKKGLPCHFCYFKRNQKILEGSSNMKKTAWVNVLQHALKKEYFIFPAMTLTHIEKGLISFWLTDAIKKFTNPHNKKNKMNDLGKSVRANLITGEKHQEQTIHWPFCECMD